MATVDRMLIGVGCVQLQLEYCSENDCDTSQVT